MLKIYVKIFEKTLNLSLRTINCYVLLIQKLKRSSVNFQLFTLIYHQHNMINKISLQITIDYTGYIGKQYSIYL